ncbi:unnamed protein product [Nyctereutes procyonoides]|uniref:(raccoon dog) hypothetical protein n=1 Tax=Nyctereutes procyonoides TaxID=34880 RepID=A0A811YHH6_NYCPR|nr:unnamed protein product [Nyctereutes procyonoides]
MELEAMSRYTSPVNHTVIPHLTMIASIKYTHDIYEELFISLETSLLIGFGVFFSLL